MSVTEEPSLKERIERIERRLDDLEDERLSEEDWQAIEAYEKEKAEGSLVSHAQLKQELGL